MSSDLDRMVHEIAQVQQKYGVPKGMGFIPDRLEIVLEREGVDQFDLTYSESFLYLPQDVLSTVKEITMQLLQQMGVPPDQILHTERGVTARMKGDVEVTLGPVIELLLQNRAVHTRLNAIFAAITTTIRVFSQLLEFQWEWNDTIRRQFEAYMGAMRDHPTFSTEVAAIIKRYRKPAN
jgi:hypothetical protein